MSSLADRQNAFSLGIRTNGATPPGLNAQRYEVYRDLVYHNLEGLLAGGFPIIKTTLATENWEALIREFLQNHRARTPLFLELGREFVDFLEQRKPAGWEPDWLIELADYERVELELAIAPGTPPLAGPITMIADAIPRLSPLARLLSYRYPVQCIGPDRDPTAAPTFLLVYRDEAEDVQFMELTPATAHLLELVEHNQGRVSVDLIHDLAQALGLSRDTVQDHALRQLEEFVIRGIIFYG